MAFLPGRWSIVIPVKRLTVAKSRLALDAELRAGVALAMATDTVRAAVAADPVALVVVVTDDEVAADSVTAAGALVTADVPAAGLNPALLHGAAEAARLAGGGPIAAISSDLPALQAADLAALLDVASADPAAVVADAAGDGTTVLTSAAGRPLQPRFGPGSRAAHLLAGAVDRTVVAAPGLRRDVDTLADLAAALRLGCGPHTQAVLARHPELLAATGAT